MAVVSPDAVQDLCARIFPALDTWRVENLTELPGGWECAIVAFDLCPVNEPRVEPLQLVLRMFWGESGSAKADHEFRSLKRLYQSGYPVPSVYAASDPGARFEHPFLIMERIPGETMWSLMSLATAAQNQVYLEQFCDLFVRLHSLDWRFFVDEAQPTWQHPYQAVDDWLLMARRTLTGSAFEHLLSIIGWLEQRRDRLPCAHPAPCHRDFHPGNILIRPDGSLVVIDWTAFTVTDPRFDLAWTMLLADAYEGEALRQAILQGYIRHLGEPVAEIEIFEVFACARRLYDISVSLAQGAEERGMRPEAVEAMKRDKAATQRVYQRLVKHTGLCIPHLEA